MADTENHEEPTLHPKRKPDPTSDDQPGFPNKTQKLQVSGDPENPEPNSDEKNDKLDSIAAPQVEEHEEDEDEEDDYEEEEHESNGKSEIDRKGKGIMRQDKGKGILIEEDGDDDDDSSDDDDDDDDTSSGDELEDSDLSDDPLAEVDLDNILPSRTRRQQFHPGVHIRNNNSNKEEENDSDDSDDAVC